MSNYHGVDHSAEHATADTQLQLNTLLKGIRHGYDFGKLGWDSIPTEPIVLVTMVLMAIGAIAVLGGITYFKKWGYLWNEWFITVDHKKLVSCISSYLLSCFCVVSPMQS